MYFSIRNILISFVLVASLSIVGFVGVGLWRSVERARTFSHIADLVFLDRSLFTALSNFRAERGNTASALLLDPTKNINTMKNVQGARERVDAAMRAFIERYAAVDDEGLQERFSRAAQSYARFVELRKKVDADVSLPLERRESGLDKTVLNLGADVIADFEAGSMLAENRALELDLGQSELLQIRASGWSARAASGNATTMIISALTQQRPFTPQEKQQLDALDAVAAYTWKATGTLVSRRTVPQSVKDIYVEGERGYFGSDFTKRRTELISDLMNGRTPSFTVDSWRGAVTEALDTVAKVASESMDVVHSRSDEAKRAAFMDAILYLVGFVLTLVFFGVCLAVIVRRVTRPICRLSQTMMGLASGDLSIDVPGAGRGDEIGEMARAVETFREAGLRKRELEMQAIANREQSDRDRVELQQRAEAEAEERLNQATRLLAEGLRRLASGDMLSEITSPLAPQFEALRHDFNSSVHQLREALTSVGQSVQTVNGGAHEVSSASDDLSRRTEQQAASLEETAAALEEITANVSATSKRAGEARDTVREARTKADLSGKVVREAVAAMERIEHSSSQIGQIIGVIDEIAFQTNLLALNAGVEAARAGDAGKGFAVVAQEVRELAQRSANAAKEIKQLINTSAVAVGEGVKLVADTGVGLSEIEQLVL